MICIEQEYEAVNIDSFEELRSEIKSHESYDILDAKSEIDFLGEVLGRISYIDNFMYSLDETKTYLVGTLDSDPDQLDLLSGLSSIASCSEVRTHDQFSTYKIIINNM